MNAQTMKNLRAAIAAAFPDGFVVKIGKGVNRTVTNIPWSEVGDGTIVRIFDTRFTNDWLNSKHGAESVDKKLELAKKRIKAGDWGDTRGDAADAMLKKILGAAFSTKVWTAACKKHKGDAGAAYVALCGGTDEAKAMLAMQRETIAKMVSMQKDAMKAMKEVTIAKK